MQKLISGVLIPLALLGSTVLGAGVTVGLTAKRTLPVRPAIFQAEGDKPADPPAAQAAPVPGAVDPVPAPVVVEKAPLPVHVARLSSDNLFAGKISVLNPITGGIEPISDVVVWFMQNGEIRSSAKPGIGGVFQAANLEPGVYSIIAWGPQGYLATAVNILPYEPPQAGPAVSQVEPVSLTTSMAGLGIDVLAVSPRDTGKMLELANAYIPASAREISTVPLAATGTELTQDEIAKVEAALNARAEDPAVPYAAVLMDGNRVPGVMTRMHPQTGKLLRFHDRTNKAFLVNGPAVVSEAWIGTDGQFVFENARAGDFTVVVAGAEGFTAFGVQIVRPIAVPPAGDVTQSASKPIILDVSMSKAAGSSGIDGSVIDMANFPAAYRQMLGALGAQQAEAAPPPAGPAGGFGGGSGGGGIGGGGGGGLGALGAALGAAGLAAALANDNGDSPNSP